ncbi:hypothetical protein J5TS2_39360 [Brevibacillus halotolerans]|nr:hypothetical protein J5TS2_39360 [Brevibacillus halotolerans]
MEEIEADVYDLYVFKKNHKGRARKYFTYLALFSYLSLLIVIYGVVYATSRCNTNANATHGGYYR